jgi:peptidoglycan/xylan/chitin deacetylase (PgdA/CDA1 family)
MILSRVWARLMPPTLVLMYHRIAAPSRDPWQLSVTPDHFAEHLEVIRRHGPRLLVRDLTRALAGRRAPRRGIVVTLDDGYADNLRHAWPLLERHDVPATVFVAAGYLGRAEGFWWDELERLVLAPSDVPSSVRLHVRGEAREYSVGPGPAERHRLFLELYWLIRPLTDPERRQVLAELAGWSGGHSPAPEEDRSLTVAELQALAGGGLVEIGAHTLTHPQLSALDRAGQAAEIHRSRDVLREVTGQDVVSFAYPYGGHADYTVESVRLVRECGFTGACATTAGAVRSSTSPFEIPRLHVEDCDGDGLTQRLARWVTAGS